MENNSKIIDVNGKVVNNNFDEQDFETLRNIKESKKNSKILEGTIIGVENTAKVAYAVIKYGNYKVIIPTELLIPNYVQAPNIPSPIDSMIYALSKRLNSNVKFIVTEYDAANKIVAANRLAAMKIDSNSKYLGSNPIVTEGSTVQAKIVCCNKGNIYVEVFGVETKILLKDLSYQRIADATKVEKYRIGKVIPVVIQSINIDKETKAITIGASAKAALPDPFDLAIKEIQEKAKYVGVVSGLSPTGIFVFMPQFNIDVFCPYPKNGIRPIVGNDATVRITKIEEEKKRFYGLISHISG